MGESIIIGILTSVLSSGGLCWAFTWYSRQRLYSLECDMADLQDRQLRSVRKAAANKRWDGEEEFDSKLTSLLQSTPEPAKRWKKWDSSRSSSSAKSSDQPSEALRRADSPEQ